MQVKSCPKCGSNVELNDNFCMQCGYNLHNNNTCPKCGGETNPGDKFCINCGNKL